MRCSVNASAFEGSCGVTENILPHIIMQAVMGRYNTAAMIRRKKKLMTSLKSLELISAVTVMSTTT